MILLIVVPLIILWAFVQKAATEASGASPPSRRAMRRRRRLARELGVDPADLEINHRVTSMEPPKVPRWLEIVCGVVLAVILALFLFSPSKG